jgi:hypothetical protein
MGISNVISFCVFGQLKDNTLACRACLGKDLTNLINSNEESLAIVLLGSYVMSAIIGNFFDNK